MILRPAGAQDAPALACIAAAAYAQGFAGIMAPDALASCDEAFFAERFAQSWPRVVVAEEDGALLGFAKTTNRHLDMLFVAPGAQGRGVGDALLKEIVGAGVNSLECFRDNAAARAFYERRGWRLTRAYSRAFMGREYAFVFYER